MENSQDFVIKNGVLTRYKGHGGDVTLPEGITEIGEDAFYGRTMLTSVAIPEGVTKIGAEAFEGCTSLTSVTVPKSVTEIGSEPDQRNHPRRRLNLVGGFRGLHRPDGRSHCSRQHKS